MIPLLAAASAIDTAGKVAGTASDLWKSLTAKSADKKDGTDSFASLLSAHGVDVGTASPSKAATAEAGKSAHHHVNRLA